MAVWPILAIHAKAATMICRDSFHTKSVVWTNRVIFPGIYL